MDTKMPPSQTHETTIVNGFTQYLAPNVYSVHRSCCVCWEGGKGKGGAGRRVRKAMTVVQARNCGSWDQSEFSGDRGELMD